LPSALALPLDEGVWHMNLERDLVEVRQGELAGFAVEAESLPDWLRLAATPLIEQGGRPLLAVHGDDPAAVALLADDLGKAGWSIRQTDCPASESSSWAGPLPDINLLQGKYGRDHCGKGAARNWMWAAAWILLWGLAETGYVAWDNSRLRGRIDDMTAQLKSVYLSADPEATRVVNPRAQMKQLLASRTDSDDRGFLGLLRMVGDGFANIKNGEIARLSFNQGKLDMEAKLDAVSTVEKLKNGLAERNVVLSVLSLNTVEQGIEAHLRAEERLP